MKRVPSQGGGGRVGLPRKKGLGRQRFFAIRQQTTGQLRFGPFVAGGEKPRIGHGGRSLKKNHSVEPGAGGSVCVAVGGWGSGNGNGPCGAGQGLGAIRDHPGTRAAAGKIDTTCGVFLCVVSRPNSGQDSQCASTCLSPTWASRHVQDASMRWPWCRIRAQCTWSRTWWAWSFGG
jgi:hypothetical protein